MVVLDELARKRRFNRSGVRYFPRGLSQVLLQSIGHSYSDSPCILECPFLRKYHHDKYHFE